MRSPSSELLPHACEWLDCSVTCESPKELYDHLCDDHVVPDNIVNDFLMCRWTGCTTRPRYGGGSHSVCYKHVKSHSRYREFSCPLSTCTATFVHEQDRNKHFVALHQTTIGHGMNTRPRHPSSSEEDNVDVDPDYERLHDGASPTPSVQEIFPDRSATVELKISCHWKSCDVVVNDPEALYTHICDVHVPLDGQGLPPYECHWKGCTRMFNHVRFLRQHTRGLHLPRWYRPFNCESCPRSFSQKCHLVVHMGRCTERRSYPRKRVFESPEDDVREIKRTRFMSSIKKAPFISESTRREQPLSSSATGGSVNVEEIIRLKVDGLIKKEIARRFGA